MINIIAAVSKNNQIGIKNQLPWRISEDLKYFKEKTNGHMVVMGRKTYESIGRPLPNRKTVVITRDRNFKPDGVIVVHSFEQALIMCSGEDESFIAGGGEIYKQFLPYVNRLYLTLVDKVIEGDTDFPHYTDNFKLISSFVGSTQTLDNHSLTFTIWERK